MADKDAAVYREHKDRLAAYQPESQFAEKIMGAALSSGVVRPGQLTEASDAPTIKERPAVPAAKAPAP